MCCKRINRNIYNNNGVLLIAAGQKITKNILEKLRALDYLDIEEIIEDNNITDIEISAINMKKVLNIKNSKIYNSAIKTVEKIALRSRDKPWFIHVNALSNYVDWLYTHAIDVAILSSMLAIALNIKDKLEDIAIGAFFHDIGKLLIPKKVIQKPMKLSQEEVYYIKQHCDLGVSMVKDFDFSQITLDIIHQHHERLDGSGYPQGLMGQEIPIHSQIVMIADIINAMTSYRPYKKITRIDLAIKELRQKADIYPQYVVDALCSFT